MRLRVHTYFFHSRQFSIVILTRFVYYQRGPSYAIARVYTTHYIYGLKKGNVLFNDALNTFYFSYNASEL